jgi:protein SCO1/2
VLTDIELFKIIPVLKHSRFRGEPILAVFFITAAISFAACRSNAGSYEAFNRDDCLRQTQLVDQKGDRIDLASLKGKPNVVDFIYTSCPGPCLMLTQKMARVAQRMQSQMGTEFGMISITVDPEHDGPTQMANYVRELRVDTKGWIFLTGSPQNIDRVLRDFQLRRQRNPDGSVEHITGVFLLGPDGREVREYDGEVVKVATVVADLQRLLVEPGAGASSPAQ